ncbi:hypothetical protein RQP53_12235 [Paucibacter sp. APW11]|uniref:Uncharacterized protein n=1 Tax=Roseateles aquae TaxID=3077235 RepID=A0ABU3PCL5_9BURK|nr:hypothetical protein [Paucibacter sp. APW11]MDT9000035.1 hypothetical protein [Paucibacter sp. APW11]
MTSASSGPLSRGISALMAFICFAAALALAGHYPLGRVAAVLGVLLGAGLGWRFWSLWPLLCLGLLPLIGFAPWSGWITFEEMDLLVLATAAGAYARAAQRAEPPRVPVWRRVLRASGSGKLFMLILALALLLALWRGLQDAGGWQFGWYQGYHEAMNSVRLAKPLLWALLLLPLWIRGSDAEPQALNHGLRGAMWAALAGASLAAVWERVAFPGFINFSSDYRTTGLFWEMHIGGAALDGCLALTLPFALLALLDERRPRPFAALLLLNALGVYAAITSFSRGVFLAVPVSLALGLALRAWQQRAARRPAAALLKTTTAAAVPDGVPLNLPLLLSLAGFAIFAVQLFPIGGYRGMLGLLLCMPLLFSLPADLRQGTPAQRLIAFALGALGGLALLALSWPLALWLPKGGYLLFSLALAVAWALRLQRQRLGEALQAFAGALEAMAWCWAVGGVAIVCGYWAGPLMLAKAAWPLLGAALLWPLALLLPAPPASRRPVSDDGHQQPAWRRQVLGLAALVLMGGLLGVMAGGDYLGSRVASASVDLEGRKSHWRDGLGMLDSREDWLLGKGLGRFTATHFFSGPPTWHTGDYRFKQDDSGRHFLALSGGKHMLGWGELFRVSQRIDEAHGLVSLSGRARAAADLQLSAEVCPKHLLYAAGCLVKPVKLKGGGQWQDFKIELGRAQGLRGDWYAPRLQMFSISVDTPGAEVDIAELSLKDDSGRQLLANGDFAEQGAHWFSSSDRYHLPWHAKNMALHQLIEQGLLGLLLLGLLSVVGMARLTLGAARAHPLAPALAAALLGFHLVGLFDSLLDVPRVAFMFYAASLLALTLRAPAGVEPPAGRRL